MTETHHAILDAIRDYLAENSKFEEKEVKAAATRARAALGNLAKLAKVRRVEIQAKKNSLGAK